MIIPVIAITRLWIAVMAATESVGQEAVFGFIAACPPQVFFY
jgi:hypothetical protein